MPEPVLIVYSILFTYLYTAPLAVKTNQRRPPVWWGSEATLDTYGRWAHGAMGGWMAEV